MFKKFTFLAPTKCNDNKYTRGVVGILAGSEKYPGSAVLCVGGARRGGAGYVKYLSQSDRVSELLLLNFPDVVPIKNFQNQKLDALVVGAGSPRLVNFPEGLPLVLDSTAVSKVNSKKNPITVLTPHEGELKYLGYQLGDREKTAQLIADDLQAIVLLKGSRSLIAAPGLEILRDSLGGPELATAGSGDILAGLIGSMLASWKPQNIQEAQQIVYRAVQAHSLAGKRARKLHNPVVATDILEALAKISI